MSGSLLSRIDPLGLDDCINIVSKGGGIHAMAGAGSDCGDSSGKSGGAIVEAPPPDGPVGGRGGGGGDWAPASANDPSDQDIDPGVAPPSISLQHMNEVGYDASFSGAEFGQELWNGFAQRAVESGIACLTTTCIGIPGLTSWAADEVSSSLSPKYESTPLMNGNTINASKIAAHGTLIAIEMAATRAWQA